MKREHKATVILTDTIHPETTFFVGLGVNCVMDYSGNVRLVIS